MPSRHSCARSIAARLAADVLGVPTLLVARTDALSAQLLTSDVDPRDRPFLTGERTQEGFFRVRDGIERAIARGLAYAPYADLLWFETSDARSREAGNSPRRSTRTFPGKLLAYNCSPSFNWRATSTERQIARSRATSARSGYKFQFVTLAGFHASTRRCSSWRRAMPRRAWPPISNCRSPSSRRGRWLHRHPPPARGRHRLFRPGARNGHRRHRLDDGARGSTEEQQFEADVARS